MTKTLKKPTTGASQDHPHPHSSPREKLVPIAPQKRYESKTNDDDDAILQYYFLLFSFKLKIEMKKRGNPLPPFPIPPTELIKVIKILILSLSTSFAEELLPRGSLFCLDRWTNCEFDSAQRQVELFNRCGMSYFAKPVRVMMA